MSAWSFFYSNVGGAALRSAFIDAATAGTSTAARSVDNMHVGCLVGALVDATAKHGWAAPIMRMPSGNGVSENATSWESMVQKT
jgi:hypothetical protein